MFKDQQGRLARLLRLEHSANILPLLHVVLYYAFLSALLAGVGESWIVWGVLVVPLCLLNYSLTIGVLHMHAHRPLFTSQRLNRCIELLLCFPSLLSAAEMRVYHVVYHHGGDNRDRDPSTTVGAERGWRALLYWCTYAYHCKAFMLREFLGASHKHRWQSERRAFVVDLGLCLAIGLVLLVMNPRGWLWDWFVPAVTTCVTTGYFAWLTHAPALEDRGSRNGSINTVSNWLNVFVHNQGYHSIHHRYPTLHWTEIPDRLSVMLQLEDSIIVPYWVTLNSAWRIARPAFFRTPKFGAAWKARLRQRMANGSTRLRYFSCFSWI